MNSSPDKLKIAFVIAWYGKDIGGGAEAECFGLVHALKKHYPEIEVEVLTTTLEEFSKDWNKPVHSIGEHLEDGVTVRRFAARAVDRHDFHPLNLFRLMPQTVDDLWIKGGQTISPLTKKEEQLYAQAMVETPDLISYIKKNRRRYDFFIFIPYMFATSFQGVLAAKNKSVIIPCLHNERYAYMHLYKKMMASASASIFHMQTEQALAQRLYSLQKKPQLVLGEMVDIHPPQGNAKRFREKYKIDSPFILYAGRKIVGKNLPQLVRYFMQAKQQNLVDKNLRLVIIGGGDLSYTPEMHPDVLDLNFIPADDKYDAYAAALCLCQPSINESFSIVMMEAWLQKTPTLVNAHCAVTNEHIQRSQGGFAYANFSEFVKHVNFYLKNATERQLMAEKGHAYVTENFSATVIIKRFVDFLREQKH